jgi:hypothetical protein
MRHLHVGGVIALGFDSSGEYLLLISHNGRGVFSTRTWDRVARDYAIAYPEGGIGLGIGPLAGLEIPVTEMNYATEEIDLDNSDGSISLHYAEGTVKVVEAGDQPASTPSALPQ